MLPPKVDEFVMDSDVYRKLVDFEKRVDATIMRKRVDAYDVMKKPNKVCVCDVAFLASLSL